MSWAGSFAEAPGSGVPFASFFDATWVGSPPFHVKLSRYVVQWDVMSGAGYPEELANLQSWYVHTLELQLTPELALDNYNCDDCAPPRSAAQYTSELEALFASFPGIRVLEAWNEPNDTHYSSYVEPPAAAGFINAAAPRSPATCSTPNPTCSNTSAGTSASSSLAIRATGASTPTTRSST
jgi:hypothetical protein